MDLRLGLTKTHCVRKYLCLIASLDESNCVPSTKSVFRLRVFLALRFWQLGTEVVVVVQIPISGHENYFCNALTRTLPTWSMSSWIKKGNANRLDWLHCSFHVLLGVVVFWGLRLREGWYRGEASHPSEVMHTGWGDASWFNIHNTIHGTLAIQTVVLTDRFYSPFQLLIRPPFRLLYPSPPKPNTASRVASTLAESL